MRFHANELVACGGCFIGLEPPQTCRVRLDSCLIGHSGEEVRVAVPAETAELLRRVPPGGPAWV
jgi:hypothetical protein